MALNKIKLSDGKFIYRCDSRGVEYPLHPVKERELGPPPSHQCKESDEIRFEAKDT